MYKKFTYKDSEISKFHIPRWNELPNIDVYLDQLVCILDDYLSNYIKNENEEKIITKTMINNYVKHHIINPPKNKKYSKEHIASLFVICTLKQVYSINDISKLIRLAIKIASPEDSYNEFCDELEMAINLTFAGEEYKNDVHMHKSKYILRNVVQSFANKLYVKRAYLNN